MGIETAPSKHDAVREYQFEVYVVAFLVWMDGTIERHSIESLQDKGHVQ